MEKYYIFNAVDAYLQHVWVAPGDRSKFWFSTECIAFP